MTVHSWRRAFAMAAAVVVGALMLAGSPSGAQAAVPDAGRYYEVVNRTSGGCLEVDYGRTFDGADATEDWCFGSVDYQKWQFRPVTGLAGYYEIVAKHSNMCLTVRGEYPSADGTNVVQEPCVGFDRQKWVLEDATSGYFQIKSQASGKCLDLAGGNWDVVQYYCYADNHNQRWLLR